MDNIFISPSKMLVDNMPSTVPVWESNTSEEKRIKFVTDLAAISRGKKESSNPESRFKHLLKEAASNPWFLKCDYVVMKLKSNGFLTIEDNDDNIVVLDIDKNNPKHLEFYNNAKDLIKNSPNNLYDKVNSDYYIKVNPYVLANDLANAGISYYGNNDSILAASRPLEFCPVVIKYKNVNFMRDVCDREIYMELELNKGTLLNISISDFVNLCKYGTLHDNKLYTNLRAIYNFLLDYFKRKVFHNSKDIEEYVYKLIPYNTEEELKTFKALRIKVPMFVWSQLMTHTALSKESQSDRVSAEDDYWLPNDIRNVIWDKYVELEDKDEYFDFERYVIEYCEIAIGLESDDDKSSIEEKIKEGNKYLLNLLLNVLPQNQCVAFFKYLGYKREIYSRVPYYFKMKEFIVTGWLKDPNAWGHLLIEREAFQDLHKSWVQKETKEIIDEIRKALF